MVPTSRHRYRRVVFDRDGLDAAVPAPAPPPGPNLDRLRSTVEEFFRVEAVVPVMLTSGATIWPRSTVCRACS